MIMTEVYAVCITTKELKQMFCEMQDEASFAELIG